MCGHWLKHKTNKKSQNTHIKHRIPDCSDSLHRFLAVTTAVFYYGMKFSLYTFQVYRLEYCFGDSKNCKEIGYKPWFFYFLKFIILSIFIAVPFIVYIWSYDHSCVPTFPDFFVPCIIAFDWFWFVLFCVFRFIFFCIFFIYVCMYVCLCVCVKLDSSRLIYENLRSNCHVVWCWYKYFVGVFACCLHGDCMFFCLHGWKNRTSRVTRVSKKPCNHHVTTMQPPCNQHATTLQTPHKHYTNTTTT